MCNLNIGFKPLDDLQKHNDFVMNLEKVKERLLHGGLYGINRSYYFCKQCRVGFQAAAPYYNVHFKEYGLNYVVQRPITGSMPACPSCRERENVERVKRGKNNE